MRRVVILPILLAFLWLMPPLHAQSQAVEVWIRAFIPNPDNAGQAAGYIVIVPSAVGSVVRLRNVDAVAPNLCFATDNRGFSTISTTSARAETKFKITPTANAATVTPAQNRTTVAVTKKIDCNTGAVLKEGPGNIPLDTIGAPAVAQGVVQVIGHDHKGDVCRYESDFESTALHLALLGKPFMQ